MKIETRVKRESRKAEDLLRLKSDSKTKQELAQLSVFVGIVK